MHQSRPVRWLKSSGRKTTAVAAAAAVALTAFAVPASSAPAPRATAQHATTHQVAANRNGVIDSRVFGTFGKQGVVRGFFVPERSLVKAGETYVQGDLAVTLRRANGTLVGRTVRQNVNLPIRASGAHTTAATTPAANNKTASAATACNILHLVLGPLNLNLLGLHVHLNRVVLDITAQSGAGNLLGNLLCAVANLLNGVNPGLLNLLKLSNALSRIIGLLG